MDKESVYSAISSRYSGERTQVENKKLAEVMAYAAKPYIDEAITLKESPVYTSGDGFDMIVKDPNPGAGSPENRTMLFGQGVAPENGKPVMYTDIVSVVKQGYSEAGKIESGYNGDLEKAAVIEATAQAYPEGSVKAQTLNEVADDIREFADQKLERS